MKRITKAAFLVIFAVMLLTGCGKQKENPNVKLGVKSVEALQYEEALTYFDTALEKGEDKRLIARGMGLAYMGMIQYEDAIQAFKEALSNSNGRVDNIDYDINYYLAVACYKTGDLEGAVNAYSAIIALKPKEKSTYILRGEVRLEKGDYEKAVADFEKAIAFDVTDYKTLVTVYECLEKYGHKEQGQVYLSNALKNKNAAMTDAQKGMIHYYLEDYENARNFLEKGREAGGEETILLLGKTYEALGDLNYAATVYSDYIGKNPQSVLIGNQLALCKIKMKDYEAALTAINEAMKIENNDMLQTLKFNEIVVYEHLGDYKKATVLMESYLSTYPDDVQAKREYEFLKTR